MSKSILVILLILSLVVFTFCTKKTTTPTEQLLPPTNLSISLVENNKIQINWIDNSTNETKFLIDRKTGEFNWFDNYSGWNEGCWIPNSFCVWEGIYKGWEGYFDKRSV